MFLFIRLVGVGLLCSSEMVSDKGGAPGGSAENSEERTDII